MLGRAVNLFVASRAVYFLPGLRHVCVTASGGLQFAVQVRQVLVRASHAVLVAVDVLRRLRAEQFRNRLASGDANDDPRSARNFHVLFLFLSNALGALMG
jgi:hypothetical protein